MSNMWKAYDCLNDEGYTHLTVNHSLNFLDPDTGAHTQRIENIHGGESIKVFLVPDIQKSLRKLPTGTVVASPLWRRSFWKHNQAYCRLKHAKMRKLILSSYTTVCTVRDPIVASWKKERKYTTSTHGNELEEGNQEGKTTKDTMKVSTDFISLRFHLKKQNYNR